jgi:hypothetical protein
MARNNANEFLAKRWSSLTRDRLADANKLPSVQVAEIKADVAPKPKPTRKDLNKDFKKGKYRCGERIFYSRRIEDIWRFARKELGAKRDQANLWRKDRPYVIVKNVKRYIFYNDVEEVKNQPF